MVLTTNNLFISIGQNCSVKFNIDKYIKSKETLFFDWLMVDMNSVNKIFEVDNVDNIDNIDNILNSENIIQNPKRPHFGNNSSIIIKSLSYCESIHDLPITFNKTHINDFVTKYKRRYTRIIEYILHHDSRINFIRFSPVTNLEKNTFISNIKKINDKCDFKLIELVNNNNNENNKSEQNFMSINLFNYKIKEINTTDWTRSFWNWEQIFIDIDNNK
jgi:hypothetical protein